MEDFKGMLGEELFGQVAEKLGDKKVFIDDGNFIPKSRFDEVNQQKNTYKTQNDELNTQLEELKKQAKGNEEFTSQIQELQNKLAESESKNKEIALDNAIKLDIVKANVKDVDVAAMLVDKSKLELTDDGVKGLKEQLDSLKELKAYLFQEEKNDGIGGSMGNHARKNNENSNSKSDLMSVIRKNQRR